MIRGIGTDIVDLDRLAQIGTDRLAHRILTERERDSMPSGERRKLEYVGGRFAAKEAIAKALGTGIGRHFTFSDVEILANEKGAPIVHCKPEWQPPTCGDAFYIHISISHATNQATAFAILEDKS
ncbi:holo-ACP synthase [Hazenella sp. IB182357]|uniref:Holo-[acyl-carrier-protein] synthase n=1 Tax=Polycladospora coralii TaxID=2771432 RepID=A0A926N9N7_9BACL|nr:holo-ACP synthase [Polycladospora coralii]MBD1372308.1 holo-ACP synthase [Polycladospora coralii]